MSVRRIVIYSGLTFSLTSLAFSLGSWTAQHHIEQQLAANDARLTALSEDLARGIERRRDVQPTASGTVGDRQPEVVAQPGRAAAQQPHELVQPRVPRTERRARWVVRDGTFRMTEGLTTITLTNDADGVVIADAVRLLRR
jgi:hypothetical protein